MFVKVLASRTNLANFSQLLTKVVDRADKGAKHKVEVVARTVSCGGGTYHAPPNALRQIRKLGTMQQSIFDYSRMFENWRRL